MKATKFFLCAGIAGLMLAGCEKDKTPTWFDDAKTKFNNARFAPELDDIFPAAMRGASTATKTSGQTKADVKTILFSELKANCMDAVDQFDRAKTMAEEIEDGKSRVLQLLESRKLTEQGVWQHNMKYETNESGDMFIYTKYNPGGSDELFQSRLTIYSNGATELFYKNSASSKSSDSVFVTYSHLKDNKFTYLRRGNNNFEVLLFDVQNGIRKYKSLFFEKGRQGYGITVITGDDQNVVYYEYGGNPQFPIIVRGIVDGISCGSRMQDIRAFSNIKHIDYEAVKKDSACYYWRKLTLTDNTVINNESVEPIWNGLSINEVQEFKNVDGIWDYAKTGGFSAYLMLDNTKANWMLPGVALSAAIPSKFDALRFIESFETAYENLKNESIGYFDNYYITEFAPFQNIKLTSANSQAFIDAILTFLQPIEDF